jgi:antitoxin (DNA-binding transcriptional repressor) of toxin-antitoxin stability system
MVLANIHELKARFSHYSRLVKSGEHVVVCDRNKPFAELRLIGNPAAKPSKRRLGQLKGQCPTGKDFWNCEEDIASSFNEGPIFPKTSKARK